MDQSDYEGDASSISDLVSGAAGASVTRSSLVETPGVSIPLAERLASGEQPQFLLRGTIMDYARTDTGGGLEEGPANRKVVPPGYALLTLVSDERLVVVIGRPDEDETQTIPFDRITEVSLKREARTRWLRVRTDEFVYTIGVDDSHEPEASEAAAYVRRQTDLDQPASDSKATESEDPIGQLERLAALRDRGILTEDEFDRKKTELLGRI